MNAVREQNQDTLKDLDDRWLAGHLSSSSGSYPVLVADDSEADIFFLLRAFQASKIQNPIFVTRTGGNTLAFLAGTGKFKNRATFPMPKIVFLDLYMPGASGLDILRWKQKQPEYAQTLFIALSNSSRTRDISSAYDLGASTFLMKPLEGSQLHNLIEAYHAFWDRIASNSAPQPA